MTKVIYDFNTQDRGIKWLEKRASNAPSASLKELQEFAQLFEPSAVLVEDSERQVLILKTQFLHPTLLLGIAKLSPWHLPFYWEPIDGS